MSPEPVREFAELAADLVQIVAADGRIVYANPAWRRALGRPGFAAGAVGLEEVLSPSSRDPVREALRRLKAGEPAVTLDLELVGGDGKPVPVRGIIRAGEAGAGGAGLATEWVLAERRPSSSPELDRLFDLCLDLLCSAGTDGYFKRINPAFRRVLGYDDAEMLSRGFLEFVHPDDRPDTLRKVEDLSRGVPVVDFQNRYRARDGSWKWLAWVSASVPEEGRIYAAARDITDARRSQELLARRTEELARSNADLERFASVASHDLQAPLRVVANLAEFLLEDLGGHPTGAVADHLRDLTDRVRRMAALTDELLQYARAGQDRGAIAPVPVGKMVQDLVRLLGAPAGFSVLVDTNLPVLETQRTPLEQVFRNLIGNAIKHHDRAEGTIRVSARDRGDSVEFTVADDGPGIPAGQHERVFEMFGRGKPRPEVEGHGIGLALVKRIVERHGGGVTLDPQAGRGAVFRFTWPRRSERADPLPGPGGDSDGKG